MNIPAKAELSFENGSKKATSNDARYTVTRCVSSLHFVSRYIYYSYNERLHVMVTSLFRPITS